VAEGVQDLIIVVVTAAVFAFGWWLTDPIKVYDKPPEDATIPPEPFDTRGLV
jgi:hypothetical protein